MQRKTIDVIELFAGVGGFRLGLEGVEEADFNVVWGNQYEPSRKVQHAFECYSKRFEGRGIHSNEDISKVDEKTLPRHNLLVGGFPCQDYSVAQSGAKGIEGKKGVLFWDIKRILEEKNPEFVLLENVDRLLKSPTKQRGRDFLVMLSVFWNLGYAVEWRVINAADYGFPQKRKRIFIFAYKNTTTYYQNRFSEELTTDYIKEGFFAQQFPVLEGESVKHPSTYLELDENTVTVSDTFKATLRNSGVMVNGKVYSVELLPDQEPVSVLGDLLESDVAEHYYLNEEEIAAWKYLKDSKTIKRVTADGFEYNYSEGQMSFPDPADRPARTMLTSEATKNRSSHVVADPHTGRLRKLTPLECERINGFRDHWTDTGMTEKFRYFCMGNALVVGLITRMGKEIAKIASSEETI